MHMLFFNTYFYKNKKSKLHFRDCVTVLNDMIYGYGGSRIIATKRRESYRYYIYTIIHAAGSRILNLGVPVTNRPIISIKLSYHPMIHPT
jgi:hypothetical protein